MFRKYVLGDFLFRTCIYRFIGDAFGVVWLYGEFCIFCWYL